MKRTNTLILTLLTFAISSFAFGANLPFKIVIDPGHGGNDEGTVYQRGGYRVTEKDVTLLIARQVARKLRARGYRVAMTRNGDQSIALPARTALANKIGADVFLSIHMNSTPSPMAREAAEGIETYILNSTSDASSRRLAVLENSVTGSKPTDTPEEMDVALILKDLRLDANLKDSKRLACEIQKNLTGVSVATNRVRTRNRGVKQALFHVLLGADMPSVLVEAGFLTNARDRDFILSARGQTLMSSAITQAIEQYRIRKNSVQALNTLSMCKVN